MSDGAQYADSGRTLTKIVKIDLKTFEVPSKVVSIVGGDSREFSAFYPCRGSIKTVTFQKGSEVQNLGGFLFASTSLESIDFTNCESLLRLSVGIFSHCSSLVNVILPPKLENISQGSFSDCRKISYLKIPDSVTTIENYHSALGGVFNNCLKLKTIEISENSQLKTIGSHTFIYSGLESLFIPKMVDHIHAGIFLHSSTKSISVSPENSVYSTDGVILFKGNDIVTTAVGNTGEYVIGKDKNLGSQAFRGSHLSKITFEDLEKEYYMTPYCFEAAYITTITLPNSMTSIPANFFQGSKLESITIPAKVKTINENAFSLCPNLMTIELPDGLLSIKNNVFIGSSKFTYILIPYNVTDFGTGVFKDCNKDLVVDFANKDRFKMEKNLIINNGKYIVEYFGNDPNIDVAIPSYCTEIGKNLFFKSLLRSVVFSADSLCEKFEDSAFKESTIQEIIFPKTLNSIGISCFETCTKLKKVVFDGSYDRIPNRCFYKCILLSNFTFITKNIKSIGQLSFYYTESLKEFDLSQLPSLATIEQYAFKETGITNVILPSSITSIGIHAFEASLTESFVCRATIDALPTYLFADSSLLASVDLGSNIKTIGQYCFTGCTSLTNFTLSPATTTIDMYVFAGCTKLEYVTIPQQSALEKIEPFAFDGCILFDRFDVKAVDKFSFEEGVLMDSSKTTIIFYIPISPRRVFVVPGTIQTISAYAFQYCYNLREIIIPDGVITRIHNDAFRNCKNLRRIFLPKSLEEIGKDAFTGCERLSCGSVFINPSIREKAIASGMEERYLTDECINQEHYIHYGLLPTLHQNRIIPRFFMFYSLLLLTDSY